MQPSRFPARALLLLAFCSSVLIGCVGPTLIVEHYPGPRRASEEIAILRFYGSDQALLVVIDGERADVRLDEDVRLHIEVLPGKHRVGVVPRDDSQGRLRWVSFETTAGRLYRVVLAGAQARAYEADPETDTLIRDVTLPES